MKTFLVHCHDEDADYAEGVLRAIADSGRHPIEVQESKPIPKRRKKKSEGSASPGVLLAVMVICIVALVGCDLDDDDHGPDGICCPTSALFELPDGTFHDCGSAPPAPGVSCPPAGVSGSACFGEPCAFVGQPVPCCCEASDGPRGAWCNPDALAAGCVERQIGFGGTCGDLL